MRLSGEGTNNLIRLHASSNLVHWKEIAVLHGANFTFADPVSARIPYRFYRFSSAELTETNDWKNQISEAEPFAGGNTYVNHYVKFAITTDEPARVYYADGRKYVFHYDFATARLEPTLGVGAEEFERISLYNDGRKVILGAVIFPHPRAARGPFPEYGIQFVSRDPLPRELVADLFELVRSTVIAYSEMRAFYVPSFEQAAAAQADRQWFEDQRISLATMGR